MEVSLLLLRLHVTDFFDVAFPSRASRLLRARSTACSMQNAKSRRLPHLSGCCAVDEAGASAERHRDRAERLAQFRARERFVHRSVELLREAGHPRVARSPVAHDERLQPKLCVAVHSIRRHIRAHFAIRRAAVCEEDHHRLVHAQVRPREDGVRLAQSVGVEGTSSTKHDASSCRRADGHGLVLEDASISKGDRRYDILRLAQPQLRHTAAR